MKTKKGKKESGGNDSSSDDEEVLWKAGIDMGLYFNDKMHCNIFTEKKRQKKERNKKKKKKIRKGKKCPVKTI